MKGIVRPPMAMPKELQELQVEKSDRRARPLMVSLIAIYEFLRAGFLLIFILLLSSSMGATQANSASPSDPWGYLYLSVQRTYCGQHSHASTVLVVTSLFAGLYAATGFGLWFLMQWARSSVMASSGYGLIRVLLFFLAIQIFNLPMPVVLQIALAVSFLLQLLVLVSLFNSASRFGADGA
jgi:hypothetical protein